MQKFLSICLLSVVLLMLQGSEEKSRPSSGKRSFLSQSDLVQSTKQQNDHSLSSSAPIPRSQSMFIPQSRKKCNDASPSSFNDLLDIGSPYMPNVLTYTAASHVFTKQKNSFEGNIPK